MKNPCYRSRRRAPKLSYQVIRGRSGLAPVADLRDDVTLDCTPLGTAWPEHCTVCRDCPICRGEAWFDSGR